jgi:hypothetical protein
MVKPILDIETEFADFLEALGAEVSDKTFCQDQD